ncbi:hydantoinase B/oxoprolinase family protein [Conexibacter sp. CPCC 206217]|uniref:hydantoinase B/oxoprolinase family protein n=1 Tax=Conexibacter sp. CPCC 206217 TaxID=3064574 RepID=UPI00271CD853|nr:hydantoinase B/oxoprolinase family protein [Conexibacter sp. CPCC 206217]MDO8212578.1 hydantoinase B/oxoprolinase family protein [Conexibacter sp. CPCC 206217]
MTQTTTPVNAITGEVIDAGLRYVVREMRATLIRLSYSPILYETHDFSCALLDPAGEVVAMHVDVPMHIFPVSFAVRELHERFGEEMEAGDVFLVNDPSTAGTHLNDVLMIRPIFLDGRLELYAAVRAHYGDVGGTVPGSVSGASTEIFHEGIRIPLVRVYRRGELEEGMLQLFLANVRTPFEAEGVFHAQAAVNRLAEQRVQALGERYGAGALHDAVAQKLEATRRRTAAAIAALPDGEYHYEDYLENSGTSGENLRAIFVRGRMRIEGETLTFDFSDCSPQRAGVGNAPYATTWAGAYTVLETVLSDVASTTTGAARQLNVVTRPGTVVDARHPVPIGGFADMLFGPVHGCCMALLAQVVPERASAVPGSSANQTNLNGPSNPQRPGEPWSIFEFPYEGWPAVHDLDGNIAGAQWCMGDLPMLWPVERGEFANPIRGVFNGLHCDSGGPGYRRGGIGIVRAWEMRADGQFSFLGSEGILPRPGMAGGYGGALNQLIVLRDGRRLPVSEVPLKVGQFAVRPGDLFITLVAGGAGYGDPLTREPERVLQDVADGYVSVAGARADYGVVLDAAGTAVEQEATRALRAELEAARLRPAVLAGDADDYDADGRRLARMSPATAARLGVVDGGVVEYAPAGRPALRAWAALDERVADDEIPLGPSGRRICAAGAGERLWLRTPWTHVAGVTALPRELERSAELLRSLG